MKSNRYRTLSEPFPSVEISNIAWERSFNVQGASFFFTEDGECLECGCGGGRYDSVELQIVAKMH